jgi:serine protease
MNLSRAVLFATALIATSSVSAQANKPPQEFNGDPSRSARAQTTSRVIVKWRKATRSLSASAKLQRAAAASGLKVQRLATVSDDLEVLQLESNASSDAAGALSKLSSDPDVEYASLDLRRKIHALPNDPLISEQWYFLGVEPAALRTEQAWDVTTGSNGTVVAVLDTGVRFDHPDLLHASQGGKLLPGYDFISGDSSGAFRMANDGDGRDADATDPGDWVTVAEAQQAPFDSDCLSETGGQVNSSWHGSRVSGLIAAVTNNAAGIAGAGWNTWVLPVRVLGKCGGFDSDIIAAMRWAAGITVSGVPANPYPAKIINLSLGGEGACTAAYQAAITEVVARGALVVVSAGNEGGTVSAPANCVGALGVTGLRHIGTKVGFSNLGPEIGISAPGGNCVNTAPGLPCVYSIAAPTNFGETIPAASGYTDKLIRINVGTSFSAPLASGTAALMHAVNARLGPEQLISRLKAAATPFPTDPTVPTCHVPTGPTDLQQDPCNCTTAACGAGMLNAANSVAQALRPSAYIMVSTPVAAGQTVTLNANASAAACSRTVSTFVWSVLSTPATGLSSTDQPTTTLTAPSSGQVVVRLTVTDSQGATDSADVAITANSSSSAARQPIAGDACPVAISVAQDAPPPTPAPTMPSGISNGGGGGGGELGWELLALALAGLVRVKRLSRRGAQMLPN